MPVILDPDSYDLWLDPGMTNVEAVSEILNGAPCPLGHYMEWRRTGRGETVRQYLPWKWRVCTREINDLWALVIFMERDAPKAHAACC
jgi:hypothetical protein